ncbi:hypothetical protein BDQ94DRAFT_149206 [Aspergillus welwitschiae]|uniref:Uncharacterized protein n=1 Tax=Aspergillus welwitschiae TaxID=1341132 RepID=A0A3F3PTG4_9EURO|nr:hypothetical protein BDQ94DRAFT_149206 [Aspergillus welwitschiae]RDH30214.1 hypothetical protein BDQ94DRAFT_149206 [Aspergillus welwitschiae]
MQRRKSISTRISPFWSSEHSKHRVTRKDMMVYSSGVSSNPKLQLSSRDTVECEYERKRKH